jgi:transposase
MDETTPPEGIPPSDWEATPASVRILLLALLERVRDLEARLNQHSGNSSKPPSSDPPSAPPRPPKTPRGRKAGGQLGHPGVTRDLVPPDQVHETVPVYPRQCPTCRTALRAGLPDAAPLMRTQVWEIPPITPHISEYQHHTVCCPQCQTLVRDDRRPTGAPPGGYGPRLTAFVALLRGEYHQSERDVATFLATLCGLPISLGSVVRCCDRMSAALAPVYTAIADAVRGQDVANIDETSWRETSQRVWLWTTVTAVATLFLVVGSRGAGALTTLLGATFRGIVGSDRWRAYNALADAQRQLCWSHLKRNFQGLVDYGHPDSPWAAQMLIQIDQVFAHWHACRTGQIDRAGLQQALIPVQAAIRALLERGQQIAWHRIQGISRELLAHWPALWTFVTTPGVEPTNNAAERALRPAVLWRKGCFGTRSHEGSRFVERLLTVSTTCAQQQKDLFPFLVRALELYWAGQPPPTLISPP